MKKQIRIGAGQGFWGDWLEAPKHLVRKGPLDYLVLDYLAEVTMSILAKQRERDPAAGYARDFVFLMRDILPDLRRKNIRVIANAGGMNPLACGRAVREEATRAGLDSEVRIAVVHGDEITGRLEELMRSGHALSNLETGEPLGTVLSRVKSANIYFGSEAIVQALEKKATIVITGRVADPSLTLAPMMHEFGWPADDWNRLAAGTVAGHLIECGAQSSGGNFSFDWKSVPDLAGIGYPVVEAGADGSFSVTKQEGTGGLVSLETVKEQLVYEIGDPAAYMSPDVVADFTSVALHQEKGDRVRVSSITGRPKPKDYKVSISYFDGYMCAGSVLYSWPEAREKATAAADIVRRRLLDAGISLHRIHTELIGVDACHGALGAPLNGDAPEVMLRIAVHDHDRAKVERFSREMAPLVLNGPPGATAYGGGKGEIREVYAYWPALLSRSAVSPAVELA